MNTANARCGAFIAAALAVGGADPVMAQSAPPGVVVLPDIDVIAPNASRSEPAPNALPPEPAPNAPISAPAPQTLQPGGEAAPVASGAPVAPSMASSMNLSGADLGNRPVTRPGEVLEAVPGLLVTQHSGEGKANQYFLRGYNLDHGTDMAIWVDDMPINLRTHAHGQGYSDLNWLMPELIGSVEVRKGPYFADEGDFGSAGNLHIGLIDRTPTIMKYTMGSFGYERLFGMGSTALGQGNLLAAGEVGFYNGPWDHPDDMRKLNGLLRYAQGSATEGFTLTGMAYSNRWNSSDQIPARAVVDGEIGRYGEIDPTDGGASSRYALSLRAAGTDALGGWKANIYAVKSLLDLYNNFTYFLTDPVNGDQFHQHDNRLLTGANLSQTLAFDVLGRPSQTVFGLQARDDSIDVGLTDTVARQFLANVRTDKVNEGSVGVYAENTILWTSWLKTILGWRGDFYAASVNSIYDSANSGHVSAGIGSPKARIVIEPMPKTEFFLGAGAGMHSNDARGATITQEPVDRVANPSAPVTALGASPLLVRTAGAEVGVRLRAILDLDSSVSLFYLHQNSETIFNGDGGDTSPSRPSVRYGVEWTNHYRPQKWLDIDADLAISHSRFTGYDSAQEQLYLSLAGYPQAQIGNAPGNYIPNAPSMIASVGVTLGEANGWSGTLRWRYQGVSPLTEDNVFRSPPISVFNGRIGYGFGNGWRIDLDALNLLNARTNQITYAYGSILKSDSLYAACFGATPTAPAAVCQNGVMDTVFHPMEPLALRLTLTGAF